MKSIWRIIWGRECERKEKEKRKNRYRVGEFDTDWAIHLGGKEKKGRDR